MSATVGNIRDDLAGLYPLHDVRLSLTDQGVEILERLGARWIKAALDSLLVDDADRRLEIVLGVSGVEPMIGGGWIQPATAGGMYLDGDAVGRLSLTALDGPEDEVLKRVLRLPSLDLLAGIGKARFGSGHGRVSRLVSKTYGAIYGRAPLALDTWKQARNSRGSDRARDSRARMGALSTASSTEMPQSERTAWFALHWLEPGGAEVWALDAAQVARDQGYRVVITVDQPAPHKWLDRALSITEHVYLAANLLAEDDWGRFLRGVVNEYRPSVVMIHHSTRAYGFLPELRHLNPSVTILDSTHVVEHRTGGFVRPSIEYSHLIDAHHVISPELRDLYLLDAGVDSSKVHYHPLISPGHVVRAAPTSSTRNGPLRVGFLGRIAAQKRPFLFVELVRRLSAKHGDEFEFVMQGSGPLDGLLAAQISRAGVGGVLQRRSWGPPEAFFEAVDVLVICSDNEGLTLTSLEADQHGVLVMSADVGSQATVVPGAALLPRAPRAFLAAAQKKLLRLAEDPSALDQAIADQHALVRDLNEHVPASEFLRGHLTEISGAN